MNIDANAIITLVFTAVCWIWAFFKIQSMTLETKLRLDELEVEVDKIKVMYQGHDKILAVQDRDSKYFRETLDEIKALLTRMIWKQ